MAALADGYATGALGQETFAHRIDAAFRARTDDELRALLGDLPGRLLDHVRTWISGPPAPPTVRIAPPPDGPGPWIIGRSPHCRLVVDVSAVSRTHAELRRTAAGWEILDLGSTNGTWVNGWRVDRATLRPEDTLTLGGVRVVLSGSRRA